MTWTFFVSGCTWRRPLLRATVELRQAPAIQARTTRSPRSSLRSGNGTRRIHVALREALQGERYRNLLASLAAAIESPTLKDDAWEPCRRALPPLAAAAWRKLKKGGRDLEAASPDADFHQVRKLAKRARYAAELIAPALGSRTAKDAKRFIRLTTQLQDILGEHQDAIVAATELQRFLARNPQDQKLAHRIHDVLETQHQAAQATRAKFFDVWKKLDRKKSLRWFKATAKVRS